MKKYSCPRCGGRMARNGYTPAGQQRWVCRTEGESRVACYSTTDPAGKTARTQSGRPARSKKTPLFKRTVGRTSTLVITAAQNATPAHKGFVKALEALCEKRNGELLAVPLRYKNPTSRWSASQANDEVWAAELTPYLCNERKRLSKNLILLGDVKVQPTASSPLNGFEAMTHGESGILGHTKLQLRTIATPQSRMPKILTTTGAATVRNYTDSRAGKLGEFHHTLGACLVEVKGKKFHIRQINADKKTGAFFDLDEVYGADYAPNGSRPLIPAAALVLGDTHVGSTDKKVMRATDEMIAFFKPKVILWHDLHDGYAVNPHHGNNPFNALAKVLSGRGDAKAEMLQAFDFLKQHTPGGSTSVVVPSNHNDFLTRWILSQDWRQAPGNADFYLETALNMVRNTRMTEHGTTYPSPFEYWGRKHFADVDNVIFLDRDESYTVCGIELGMHGDKGPNGARGSIKNLRRIGVKSVIAHAHSSGIDEGCYQVGTSTALRAEYTSGPSSWLNTHCLIYPSGKRTLLNIIEGDWRL